MATCSVTSRHLAQRIDRQIGRLALLAGLRVQQTQLIGRAELFEQGQGAGGAGLRRMIEGDGVGRGHGVILAVRKLAGAGRYDRRAHIAPTYLSERVRLV
jgi:hypothetical protein